MNRFLVAIPFACAFAVFACSSAETPGDPSEITASAEQPLATYTLGDERLTFLGDKWRGFEDTTVHVELVYENGADRHTAILDSGDAAAADTARALFAHASPALLEHVRLESKLRLEQAEAEVELYAEEARGGTQTFSDAALADARRVSAWQFTQWGMSDAYAYPQGETPQHGTGCWCHAWAPDCWFGGNTGRTYCWEGITFHWDGHSCCK